VITSIESLLLRELQEAYQMFRHSEDLGDRRVNYLITLVSAILGALAIRKEGLGSAGHAVDPIFYYFTTVLIILALVTLRRVLERNVRSSEQLLAVAQVHRFFTDLAQGAVNLSAARPLDRPAAATSLEEYLYFRRPQDGPRVDRRMEWWQILTLGKGGLAETVAFVISVLSGFLLGLITFDTNQSEVGAIAAGVLVAMLTWASLFAFMKRHYDRIFRGDPSALQRLWNARRMNDNRGQHFRANVGIAVLRTDGRVLALERYENPGTWQLPQGGLEVGEEPSDAARRELAEETGLQWDQVKLLGEHPEWLAYELPQSARKRDIGRGQVQKWFVVELLDEGAVVDFSREDKRKGTPEFRGSEWLTFDELIAVAVDFRRAVYARVAEIARTLSADDRTTGSA
jgi:putative (di)nucleoside polyphosphate hydrolase